MNSSSPEITRSAAEQTLLPRSPGSLYLLYHELTCAETEYGYALKTREFERQLKLVQRARSEGAGMYWPEITFDDGHLSNVLHALPILASAGLSARFFITAGWTATRPGYMNWEQLRQLQDAGQQIGAHGWSHVLLTHCTDADLETELKAARLLLEDKLGMSITTMSLPGGRYNSRVLRACEEAGYTQVFTSTPRVEISSSAALLGRLNVRSGAAPDWLGSVLRPETGELPRLERQQRWKAAAQRVLGDRVYHRLWAYLNREPAAVDVPA